MVNAFARSGLLLTALAICIYFAASLTNLRHAEAALQTTAAAQNKSLKSIDKVDSKARARLEAVAKEVGELATKGDSGALVVMETLRQHGLVEIRAEPVSPPASPSTRH